MQGHRAFVLVEIRQNVHTKQVLTSAQDSDILEARKTFGLETKQDTSLLKGANLKTGRMTTREFAEYRRELANIQGLKELDLPAQEKAWVTRELNNHMSKEDRGKAIVVKEIGHYVYTVINRGFGDYTIVRKEDIDTSVDNWMKSKGRG